MEHHRGAEERPLGFGHEAHEVFFDRLRLVVRREPEPLTHAAHVRVDDHARWDVPHGVEHHVRGLARDSGQLDEVKDVLRHFPAELIDQHLTSASDRFGLGAKKPARLDVFFELIHGHTEVVRGLLVFDEQRLRELIDARVRRLGREDRRNEELERARPVQLVLRVLVLVVKLRQHGPDFVVLLGGHAPSVSACSERVGLSP